MNRDIRLNTDARYAIFVWVGFFLAEAAAAGILWHDGDVHAAIVCAALGVIAYMMVGRRTRRGELPPAHPQAAVSGHIAAAVWAGALILTCATPVNTGFVAGAAAYTAHHHAVASSWRQVHAYGMSATISGCVVGLADMLGLSALGMALVCAGLLGALLVLWTALEVSAWATSRRALLTALRDPAMFAGSGILCAVGTASATTSVGHVIGGAALALAILGSAAACAQAMLRPAWLPPDGGGKEDIPANDPECAPQPPLRLIG